MKPLCDTAYQACKWIIILFGYFLVGVIFVGIISRYLFHRPIIWEYELCIALFIWCTFLGAATCFRDKQHIAFGMLVGILPNAPKKLVMALKNLLVVAGLVLGVYCGFRVVGATTAIQYQTLPFSLAFSYAALPVGFLISLLFVVESLVNGGVSAE